ncbi:Glycerophosphoryl diester phosphodiesterase [hydrothermal vent metagenome]|uniref:Glycerophosphoryl diester phosphodiesterase n=1 Tax=hydrothermal vent metagenome TaxID=652676 RepID=A0A3B1BD19_9ZZZZ
MISAADQLIAHRGYPRHYPENTLAGIAAAITAGARFIEVDVQLTADGIAVLFHDRDLQRLCVRAGSLHEYNWQEVQTFPVRGPAQSVDLAREESVSQGSIPRLKELTRLLQAFPDITAFIELKRISLAHFGEYEMLTKVFIDLQPVLTQCVMLSYSLTALEKIREQGRQPIAVVADDWHALSQQQVQALQAEYLFCDIESLPDDGPLQLPGSRLAVYECIDAKQARAVLARGVDLVETFAIGEMLTSLQKNARV